jgi:DNA-binding LacI/PurR family transcriptional regulator
MAPPHPPPEIPGPPSIRLVATLAGVSAMTASRALGSRGRIADETRRRIVAIAEQIGYRPDPELNKLMHHLRGRRRPAFQSVICAVTTRPTSSREPYSEAVAAGAKRQAELRGYNFTLLRVATDPAKWSGVQRILRSRGVQGVLLLPQHQPMDLSRLLDWSGFSAVAATSSLIAPALHRVMPHHFANALLLCRELAAAGHRRIGLVIGREHDLRVNHLFTAAVTWHGLNEAAELVPPLVYAETLAGELRPWFARHRPDVIVATEYPAVRACLHALRLSVPGRVGFACTSVGKTGDRETEKIPGIDELPEQIGAAAVDLLSSMIERRICGLPAATTSSLIHGCWRPAATVPPRA